MKSFTRRDLMKTAPMGLAAAMLPGVSELAAQAASDTPTAKRPNILFLIVDDMRPQMTCYGEKNMVTPHIDALAAQSVMFRSNYCQQAICSPSRTSLLTGCRPDTTQVYDLVKYFRDFIPNVVTLPEQFKKHGYFTQSIGKVYHGFEVDDPASWSIPSTYSSSDLEFEQYQRPESYKEWTERLSQISSHGAISGPAMEFVDAPDENYPDARVASEAIRRLQVLRARDTGDPFFLAVGFHKPHLPFVAPKKYWDLYDSDKIDLPAWRQAPKGAPSYAMTNFEELRHYYGIPWDKKPLPDSMCRDLIHGYYAGVSFTDAQIGRVLSALHEEGLADNTIVILCVDHGWHLNDHGMWTKHTNFEHATHVPLMIHAPGLAPGKVNTLTENVDIYPTLCDLAGLPKPDTLEGTSMLPLLHDPARAWGKASFSQYPRGNNIMGYTMRTERYRYTRWMRKNDDLPWKDSKGQTLMAEELYDYQNDPDESTNWATDPHYASALADLRAQSAAGWQAAKPSA